MPLSDIYGTLGNRPAQRNCPPAYDTPSPAAFVGELGFTGVLPLTSNLDFRFGYLVFWLQGIAQPTRQLSLPVSTTGDPLVLQDGGTVVQGLTLGLEGRW